MQHKWFINWIEIRLRGRKLLEGALPLAALVGLNTPPGRFLNARAGMINEAD